MTNAFQIAVLHMFSRANMSLGPVSRLQATVWIRPISVLASKHQEPKQKAGSSPERSERAESEYAYTPGPISFGYLCARKASSSSMPGSVHDLHRDDIGIERRDRRQGCLRIRSSTYAYELAFRRLPYSSRGERLLLPSRGKPRPVFATKRKTFPQCGFVDLNDVDSSTFQVFNFVTQCNGNLPGCLAAAECRSGQKTIEGW